MIRDSGSRGGGRWTGRKGVGMGKIGSGEGKGVNAGRKSGVDGWRMQGRRTRRKSKK